MARSLEGSSAAAAALLLLCAAFVERGAALHLCVDRLSNTMYSRHDDGLPHLTPTEEATWMTLLPRKHRGGGARAEFDWMTLYRSMTRNGPDSARRPGLGELLSPVPLHDVRLDDQENSMYWQAQQTNLEYLLSLDPDRLTWSFRKQAGLPPVGEPYGGWEAPDGQLRGHFVGESVCFSNILSSARLAVTVPISVRHRLIASLICVRAGHYLSASAHATASTGNDTLRERMTRVVDILYLCQKKMGTGYLSAYPETEFDAYDQLNEAWSPYYTIHKVR
jgi:uncharacterized protein